MISVASRRADSSLISTSSMISASRMNEDSLDSTSISSTVGPTATSEMSSSTNWTSATSLRGSSVSIMADSISSMSISSATGDGSARTCAFDGIDTLTWKTGSSTMTFSSITLTMGISSALTGRTTSSTISSLSSIAALRPDKAEVIAAAVAPSAVPMAAAVADEIPATPALSRMANKPPLTAEASHEAAIDPATMPEFRMTRNKSINQLII